MATDIVMPSVDPSMRSGRLTRWLRREGDFIEAGEPIAEIATERATMDVESPQTGVLARLLVEAGEAPIAVDRPIARIDPHPAPHEQQRRAPISPRARRLAHEAGCDLTSVAGSGPRGRIVERDVRAALAGAALQGAPAPQDEDGIGLTPLSLAAPWAPQAHLEADCNLEALEKLRARLNESAREQKAGKISLVDCVVKALAMALQRHPRANVIHAREVFAPALHSNIGMAMAVEGRLATPVLAAAEKLTLAEIAAAREKFMAGQLPPAALMAGRFAAAGLGAGSSLVVDYGDFGVKRVFPVIFAPWTLILSIGEAENRVVVEDSAPAVAAILSVTLTIDRRAMDEIAGAMLLDALRQLIENPYALLI